MPNKNPSCAVSISSELLSLIPTTYCGEHTETLQKYLRCVRLLNFKSIKHDEVDSVQRITSQCTCPAHDDRQQSLTITYVKNEEEKILFYCHAGCSYQDIIKQIKASAQQTAQQVSYEKKTPQKKSPRTKPSAVSYTTSLEFVSSYTYYNAQGDPVHRVKKYNEFDTVGGEKVLLGKTFKTYKLVDGVEQVGLTREEKVLYNLPLLEKARKNGAPVVYVEGEKDADNVIKYLKLTATTNLHGAEKWEPQYVEMLQGIKTLILVPDNDTTGVRAVKRIAAHLKKKLKGCTIITLPPFTTRKGEDGKEEPTSKGYDVSDWIEDGGTFESFKQLIKKARKEIKEEIKEETNKLGEEEKKEEEGSVERWEEGKEGDKEGKEEGDSEELGDGLPFTDAGNAARLAQKYADSLCYMYQLKSWAQFKAGKWSIDDGSADYRAIGELASELHRKALEIQPFDEYEESYKKEAIKNALSLQSTVKHKAVSGKAKTMLEFSKNTNLFDTHVYLKNCLNGVVDLRNASLRPAVASDYFIKQAPVNYTKNYSLPERLIAFLERCFELKEHRNDKTHAYLENEYGESVEITEEYLNKDYEEVMDYIQKLCGSVLLGVNPQQRFILLYGKGGTGKSTFLNVLKRILGEDEQSGYAATTALDTFCEDRFGSGGGKGPTPELAKLRGCRMVLGGELTKGARLAENVLKAITGAGSISCRGLNKDPITYTPQFLLFLEANKSVYIDPSDTGMKRRLEIVPFNNSISDSEDRIGDYEEILLKDKENIFAWMVEGAVKVLQEGSRYPARFAAAVESYREDLDNVKRFISEMCEVGETLRASRSDMYECYKTWCEEIGEKPFNTRNFCKEMQDKGIEYKMVRATGEGRRGKTFRGFIGVAPIKNWRSELANSSHVESLLSDSSDEDDEDF